MRFFSRQLDIIFILILISFNLLFLWQFIGSPYPEVSISAPTIPALGAVISKVAPFSFWQTAGILTIFSFPLLSVTWYLCLRKILANPILAFAASLIFLLPFSFRERFVIFWDAGDIAHGLSLAFIPLVILAFGEFLRKASINAFLFSFMGVAVVSLISPFGFLNLAFFSAFLTMSEMLLGQARVKLLRFFMVFLFGFGISAFWYHPAFLIALAQSQQGSAAFTALSKLVPLSFFVVPTFGALSFLIFDRKTHLQSLFLAASLSFFYLMVVSAARFGMELPSPSRFLPEFSLSLSFLIVSLTASLWQLWQTKILGGLQLSPRLGLLHSSREFLVATFFVALLTWPLFSFFSGETFLEINNQNQVLGAQDVRWGSAREGVSHLVGYLISGTTLLSTLFLKLKLKS